MPDLNEYTSDLDRLLNFLKIYSLHQYLFFLLTNTIRWHRQDETSDSMTVSVMHLDRVFGSIDGVCKGVE